MKCLHRAFRTLPTAERERERLRLRREWYSAYCNDCGYWRWVLDR